MGAERTRLGGEAAVLFGQYLEKIERCVALLDEDQVWWRANPSSNSVGNLLLHLVGNLSQWVLAGLGGEAHSRDRDSEFAAGGGASPAELVARLGAVVERCIAVSGRLSAADLAARHVIQGYESDGFGVLLHAVEHMAYHTGQIVLLAKQIAPGGGEIEFYPHLRPRRP